MNNFDAIDKFLNRVKTASKTRSKDIRLSIEEATQLTVELSDLLNKLNKKDVKDETISLEINGGSFTSKQE